MSWNRITIVGLILAVAGLLIMPTSARCDEPGPPTPAAPAAEPAPPAAEPAAPATPPQPSDGAPNPTEPPGDATPLSMKQDAVAQRYRRFEKTLQQMAEYMRKTDPDRANLLYRASNQSSQDRISPRLEEIVALLANEHPQFGEAVERQQEVGQFLQALLKLLQSEDRKSDLEKEKKRIEEIQQEVNRLIVRQKDVRNKTDRRPGNADPIADEQQKLADDARKLGEKIDQQDREKQGDAGQSKRGSKSQGNDKKESGEPKEDEGSEGQPESKNPDGTPSESGKPDGKSSEDKQGDDKKSNEKKADEKKQDEKKAEDKDNEKKGDEKSPSESGGQSGKPDGKGKEPKEQNKQEQGPSGKGKSGEGEQQDGEAGKQQQEQQQEQEESADQKPERTPGREEIEKARQEMEEAIEKLKSKKFDDASGHQDEALKQLIAAKEKLEEILRQLREEERELMLAALEARFQKMLAMQILVNSSTTDLSKVAKPEWTSQQFGRTRELSGQEDDIAVEAAKALNLLKEEGSSVAFPEAVEQIHQDMVTVARRLERSEVGELTQGIEQDIVESLQEIVEALRKEMEKLKDEKNQQQKKQQQQKDGDESLVDAIAELKMLRSLQHRINRRTKQLGGLTKGEQATEHDVVTQLQQLSQRQARVQEATYDLSTGKNQ